MSLNTHGKCFPAIELFSPLEEENQNRYSITLYKIVDSCGVCAVQVCAYKGSDPYMHRALNWCEWKMVGDKLDRTYPGYCLYKMMDNAAEDKEEEEVF